MIVNRKGQTLLIPADSVVVATGSTADRRLFQSLQEKISHVYEAGDCVEPRTLMEAIDEGMRIGLEI